MVLPSLVSRFLSVFPCIHFLVAVGTKRRVTQLFHSGWWDKFYVTSKELLYTPIVTSVLYTRYCAHFIHFSKNLYPPIVTSVLYTRYCDTLQSAFNISFFEEPLSSYLQQDAVVFKMFMVYGIVLATHDAVTELRGVGIRP